MPYSEMWFGDYPDFPARRHGTGEALGDVLARHGETLLGRRVVEEFGGQLPFLPKVGFSLSLSHLPTYLRHVPVTASSTHAAYSRWKQLANNRRVFLFFHFIGGVDGPGLARRMKLGIGL